MSAAAPTPELVALTLADARLPTGGHTQSAGLEPAVRTGLGDDGRRLDDVASYARGRLRTVVRVEAGTAVVARHHALARKPLGAIEAHWAARTPSQALRAASLRQGRAYLRLAARVWPEVLQHLVADTETPRAIVVGVVAAVTGLDARATVRLVGYEDAQTVVAASPKLLPVDPIEATSWLVSLHPVIEALAEELAGLGAPEAIPADSAPLIDQLAQQHADERSRLFHA